MYNLGAFADKDGLVRFRVQKVTAMIISYLFKNAFLQHDTGQRFSIKDHLAQCFWKGVALM